MKSYHSIIITTIIASFTTQVNSQTDTIRQTDVVNLKLAGVPDRDIASISGVYPLSDKGCIALPYLKDEILAKGQKAAALARTIEAAYIKAGIFTNPRATVLPPSASDDPGRTITVGGEVKSPGLVVWREGITLLDAIIEKSGFTDFARASKVRLMRNGQTQVYDLSDVSKRPDQNVTLQIKDRIIVPGSGF